MTNQKIYRVKILNIIAHDMPIGWETFWIKSNNYPYGNCVSPSDCAWTYNENDVEIIEEINTTGKTLENTGSSLLSAIGDKPKSINIEF